jgi:hypothetical protein
MRKAERFAKNNESDAKGGPHTENIRFRRRFLSENAAWLLSTNAHLSWEFLTKAFMIKMATAGLN